MTLIGLSPATTRNRRQQIAAAAVSFAPTGLPNLALWFNAGAITGKTNGQAISQWDDASGNTRHAAQATGGKQPTYLAAGPNSKPAVLFDTTDDCLQTPAWDPANDTVTFYAVASFPAGTDRIIYEHGASGFTVNGTFAFTRTAGNKASMGGDANSVNERQSTATLSGTSTYGMLCGTFNRWLGNRRHQSSIYLNGDQTGDLTSFATAGQVLVSAVGNIGSRNNGASLPSGMRLAELIAYDAAHTAGQRKQVEDYLFGKYAITRRSIVANLVFEGDSLTEGDPLFSDSYPQQLVNRLTDGAHFSVPALSGQQIGAARTGNLAGPLYSSNVAKNIVLLWGGTNDMAPNVGNQTAATALTRYFGYADDLRLLGFQTIGFTCLDRNDQAGGQATFDSRRATFNTTVRAEWMNHFDVLADVDADASLDDAADVTFFQADATHLTVAGYGKVADLAETALGTLGVT